MSVTPESPTAPPRAASLRVVPGPARSGPDGTSAAIERSDEGAAGPAAQACASMADRVAALRRSRARAVTGDARASARQHANGKRTARERLDLLLDADSFLEVDTFRRGRTLAAADGPAGDGVVAGSGLIDGRRVCVYAQDFTVAGGSLGEAHASTIQKVMDLAVRTGSPLISLCDSGGARIQEGIVALNGYGGIFQRSVAASGVIPQIAVVLGPCAGGAAYAPALADVTFMVADISRMYLTGPDVVATVTGERVTHEELGGVGVHGQFSGLATFVNSDEEECLADVRLLVSLLPRNNVEPAPSAGPTGATRDRRPALEELVPLDPHQGYDMRDVIAEIVDDGALFEFHETWATNIICTLARLDGAVVAVVANQPRVLAGVLDRSASEKAARFVRFCDAFGIPLITLVDVPGFLPGLDQERAGIIRHGAKLLYAYCEATVPRVQVVLRKAYGGAYIVMDSRSVGCDLSLAWPSNQIAVLGADAAVDIVHRRELAAAADPAALRAELTRSYAERYLNPYHAAERGLVDEIIEPADTRRALARALAALADKRQERPLRKHGNVPL
jgi:acetyl-CoA carboxylase carboxyltransferase component